MAVIELRYKDPYDLKILDVKKFSLDDKTRNIETADRDRTLFETFVSFHLLNLFESVVLSRSAFTPNYYIVSVSCNADYFNLLYWLSDNAEVMK